MATEDCEVVITAREQAQLLPAQRPAGALSEHEIAGHTVSTLISAGTEPAHAYQGSSFPARVGYAAVFRVEDVGSGVTGFSPGDLAFCMGSHRSFQRLPAGDALRLPDGLAPEAAVFARLMGVTMSTLTTTTARPPQIVMITGLGPVGHLAAQVFSACGYQVLGCDPSEPRREFLRERGVHDLFPAVPLEEPAFHKQVALAVDCSGHEAAVMDACRIVRKRGEVVLLGTPWQRRTELTAHALMHEVFHNYVVMRSGWEWEVPRHPTDFRTGSQFQNFAAALHWLADGRVKVDGLYETLPPDQAQQAYQNLLHGTTRFLATQFKW